MLFLPNPHETGPVHTRIMALRDGLVNMYIIRASTALVCIDTGWRASRIRKGFATLNLNIRDVAAVFLTHLHWDHAGCAGLFPDATIFVGEHEPPALVVNRPKSSPLWVKVCDNQEITVADLSVRIVNTPGHSAGSVSLLVDEKFLFTGDGLRLRQGKALSFPSWCNQDQHSHIRSIRRLSGISGVEWLLTGHSGVSDNLDLAFSRWRTPAFCQGPKGENH